MNKVSTRQMMLMVITIVISPAVRLFSSYVNEETNQSGWIGVAVAGVVMLLFSGVLLFLGKQKKSLGVLFEEAFGKIAGKLVAIAVVIWGTLMISLQMGYYGVRLTSSVYLDSDIDIFIIVMAILCCFALKNGISVLARANEIITVIIVPVAIALLILLTRTVNLNELVPIDRPQDIFHVASCVLASFGYMTFFLLFADEISDIKSFAHWRFYTVLSMTGLTLWMFLAVLGNAGAYVTQKLPYPFFSVVKQITVGEFIQHIEALTVALWMLSDFVVIAFSVISMLKLMSVTFDTEKNVLLVPYVALCVTLVPIMGKTSYERQMISSKLFVPANIAVLLILPTAAALAIKLKSVFASKAQ